MCKLNYTTLVLSPSNGILYTSCHIAPLENHFTVKCAPTMSVGSLNLLHRNLGT